MPQLDFNLLLDLDALLSEGSVVGAARRLHLSAPAMSRRLSKLREAVGDPLFVPAGRGLVPTQRALALRERVQAAIQEVQSVFTPDEVDFSRLQRTLTLRANDGFAGAWAARLATNIAAEAPSVALHFVPQPDERIAALRDGIVDLDLGVLKVAEPNIYTQPLMQADFVGVVRENHPITKQMSSHGKAVSTEDFIAWPHISASRCGLATGHLDVALHALGLQRRVALVAPGFQAALLMAASSDLIAIMPEPFARWAQVQQRIQIFNIPVATPPVAIAQHWHLRSHHDPVHRWLREHVRALCAAGLEVR